MHLPNLIRSSQQEGSTIRTESAIDKLPKKSDNAQGISESMA
jgi:hypothetical protein